MIYYADLGDLGEEKFWIDYSYLPGHPGVHTLRNGDPGYPPEGPEIEILHVFHLDDSHPAAEQEVPLWMLRLFQKDEGLLEACASDWEDSRRKPAQEEPW